jgi:Prealbumin-like fold domain
MTAVRKSRRGIGLTVSLIAVATGLVFALTASTAALPGSNFEITDGNLRVDGAPPALDWANVNEIRRTDLPSGSGDDAFGQGAKEDTPVPTVVSGGVPPQKSDLRTFGFYLEENSAGRFLNMFWTRVQSPQGTTNMDFVFNKSSTISANGVTPVRTSGDVLIQYDLSQGGTNPTLWASSWIDGTEGATAADCEANNALPCWRERVDLTAAGIAEGSINTSPIPAAESDGLGALDARTFGEAQVDLTALTGGANVCAVFGSAYLTSRSSDSFNAEIKDFIAPLNLNLDQCGRVVIRKVTEPASDPAQVRFGYTKNINTESTTDPTFTLGHGESKVYNDVLLGTGYTVVEDVIPANWQFARIDCSASSPGVDPIIVGAQITFDIDSADDVLDCTYINTLREGAIQITKTRKHAASGPGNHPHAGVDFTVTGPGGFSQTVTTNAAGVACVDGLIFGDYVATETVPAGYSSDDAVKEATVNNNATCEDSPFVGEPLTFHNTPLTNITISVDSQVDGGTASTINCGDPGDPVSTGPNGDGSKQKMNLAPGTYTCVVVVDP